MARFMACLHRWRGFRYGDDRTAATLHIEDFRLHSRIFQDRREQLVWALHKSAGTDGLIMEFGVWQGGSINYLAKEFPDLTFWGFDSFEGLPERWVRTKQGDSYEKGHFSIDGLPNVWSNVNLVKGFFENSLDLWLTEHPGPARLVHIDCDLYGGAKYVLDALNLRIVRGTVIVFDELCDWEDSGVYDNWEAGEWRALREWLKEKKRKIRILSRDVRYSAVVEVVD